MLTDSPRRELSRPKLIVFALITTPGVLGGLNLLVEGLEETAGLETHRPDDAVSMVEEGLF
ncbi:MAG: hypothetical protein GY898_01075 [Proteobacteria bacterium]|nr:hypothetical protein [Pseudomonadota bacterium]